MALHVRGATDFERRQSSKKPPACQLDVVEELRTASLGNGAASTYDLTLDGRETPRAETRLNDLWPPMRDAIFARLKAAKEAAVVVCGPKHSGKSGVLFGEEMNSSSPAAGILPRFAREIFEGPSPQANVPRPDLVEVQMLHLSGESL